MLFDIDWQGTQQLKQQARDDLVSIFVLPPSHDELERRLRARAQDSDDVVARRMAKAATRSATGRNMTMSSSTATSTARWSQIKAILEAERARRTRLIGVGEFVAGLTR